MEYDLCNSQQSMPIHGVNTKHIVNHIKSGSISMEGFIRPSGTNQWTALKALVAKLIPSQDNTKMIACIKCGERYQIEDAHMGAVTRCQCEELMIIPDKKAWNPSLQKTKKLDSSLILSNDSPPIKEGNICCPHCWTHFSLESLYYQSQHPDLIGDSVLGEGAQRRFLPSNYNGKGEVLDDMGLICTRMACPNCHLTIPESIVDADSSYYSFIGVPGSGKSYYLTLVTRYMKHNLKHNFGVSYSESDPEMNSVLLEYDRLLSIYDDPTALVTLPKTQQTGNSFSNQVLLNGLLTDLPKPFIFLYKNDMTEKKHLRNVIMYDNAGEHFQIGADNVLNPATMHLIISEGLLFLFDPSADAKMRHHCNSSDPQVLDTSKLTNQTAIISEVIARLRRFKGLRPDQNYDNPLIVVVGKYDFWRHLFPLYCDEQALTVFNPQDLSTQFDYPAIIETSFRLRELLMQFAPDFIHTAESFFKTVIFVPSSNFGDFAKKAPNGSIGIRPAEINPIWITTPMLTQLGLNGHLPIREDKTPHYVDKNRVQTINDTIRGSHLIFVINEKRYNLPTLYNGYVIDVEGNKYRIISDVKREEIVNTAQENNDAFWNE